MAFIKRKGATIKKLLSNGECEDQFQICMHISYAFNIHLLFAFVLVKGKLMYIIRQLNQTREKTRSHIIFYNGCNKTTFNFLLFNLF